jgi:hypothetical protein
LAISTPNVFTFDDGPPQRVDDAKGVQSGHFTFTRDIKSDRRGIPTPSGIDRPEPHAPCRARTAPPIQLSDSMAPARHKAHPNS